MGSRIILPFNNSREFIQKKIPEEDIVKNYDFPLLDEFMDCKDNLYYLKNEAEFKTWPAIEQQYNEWYNWYTASEDIRRFLAPIVGTSYDENCLPILHFPRFTPIVDENVVFAHNETENLITFGMNLQHFGITYTEVIDFLRELPQVCDYLGLIEDDILKNPSNIGWHSVFGLRIIDYGLIINV